MDLPDSLNATGRRVATALLAARPEFSSGIRVLDDGHLEASLSAPNASQAGALVVSTAHAGDIWVRFAPPRMWYPVDDEHELLTIIEQLVADAVVFVRIEDSLGEWMETTLRPSSIQPTLLPGQTATIRSWSIVRPADAWLQPRSAGRS
jgi:hypothetical protein